MSAGRPLRVCLAIGTLGVGGAETQLVGIARGLARQGFDVEVLLLSSRGPLAEPLERDGIPVHCLGFAGMRVRESLRRPWLLVSDARRLLSAVGFLRRQRYDVLHAFLFHAYALLLPMASLARVPVRIAGRRGLHGALPPHPLRELLTALSNRLAAAVVANSVAVAEDAHASEGVPRAKLRVIPNAVELPAELARPEVQPATGLCIANLIHYKGHLDLVAAVAQVERPPVIRCVGEGPMRRSVEDAIAGHGLGEVVLLEGHRPAARALYQQVQFAVLSSHHEGMPNAVLEAMAAGLPVVATDVGGCRELIDDGVTGWLVPPRDPKAMATAIQRCAEDPAWRVAAGLAARHRAASFDWAHCVQAHADLYLELVVRRRAAA